MDPSNARKLQLQKFLNAPINSRTRERIFYNRLYFDVKLAAARHDYALTVFEPEVDREGFDVVLDDADTTRHFQLKSATQSSRTKTWITSRRFMRPSIGSHEQMWFEASPEGVGLGGGVITAVIDDERDDCPVTYLYTDLYVIAAFAIGLIRQRSGTGAKRQLRRNQATRILGELHKDGPHEKVHLPRGVFLKVRSPDCLLAIAGLHSIETGIHWTHNLEAAYFNHFEADHLGLPRPSIERTVLAHAATASESLLKFVNEPDLESFRSGMKTA